jgi:hypothetical protein
MASYPTLANPIPPLPQPSNEGQGYSQWGTRATLDLVVLDPIMPAPVRDHREFDFTDRIGDANDVIRDVAWSIVVSPASRVKDPTPEARLIGEPIIDETGQKTSHLIGDCIENVIYYLTVRATITDGRVLVVRGQLACLTDVTRPIALRNGAVPFNYDLWLARYPEFREVSQSQAEGFWENASLIFRNDFTSPEPDVRIRQVLLQCLTAHIAALFGGPNGGGGFGLALTGTVSSKSVGSVSLSAGGWPGVQGTQAWYLQTAYGAEFWRKTAAYRLFKYVSGPTRFPPYSWSPGRFIW